MKSHLLPVCCPRKPPGRFAVAIIIKFNSVWTIQATTLYIPAAALGYTRIQWHTYKYQFINTVIKVPTSGCSFWIKCAKIH